MSLCHLPCNFGRRVFFLSPAPTKFLFPFGVEEEDAFLLNLGWETEGGVRAEKFGRGFQLGGSHN